MLNTHPRWWAILQKPFSRTVSSHSFCAFFSPSSEPPQLPRAFQCFQLQLQPARKMQSTDTIFSFETRSVRPRPSEATLAGREHVGIGMPSVATLVPPVPDFLPEDHDPFKVQLTEHDPEHPRVCLHPAPFRFWR